MEREGEERDRARRLAAQGMVLLENTGILPLEHAEQIALFGGGAVQSRADTGAEEISARQGLLDAGVVITSEDWLDRYSALQETGPLSDQAPASGELLPCGKPEDPLIREEDLLASDRDIAVYVLARPGTAGRDRRNVPGDYALTANEKANITLLAENFRRFVIVLKTEGPIDTAFLRATKGVGAVLLLGEAGAEGGAALAEVLLGRVSPSGHLADTWPQQYADWPTSGTSGFPGGTLNDAYYTEGIYVGYRYFDTFNIAPAYPFGYGLTYGYLSIGYIRTVLNGGVVTVFASVTNRGSRAAAASVQVYVSAPAGRIAKPYQELRGYEKSKELAPGERQELEISFLFAACASFDEAAGAFVLEPGRYFIRLGDSSRSTHIVCALTLDREVTVQKVRRIGECDASMGVILASGALPYSYSGEAREKELAPELEIRAEDLPAEEPETPEPVYAEGESSARHAITLEEVEARLYPLRELLSQLQEDELAKICLGAPLWTEKGGVGEDDRDVPSFLKDRRIPELTLADGTCAGTGRKLPGAALLPSASVLARTWDRGCGRSAGDFLGGRMEESGTDLLLLPRLNIRRSPLAGGSAGSLSEDPLLAGTMGAAYALGIRQHRARGAVIRYFVCRNREDNRRHLNVHVTERALREIYLRPFELCTKGAAPAAVLAAANLIGGRHVAESRDLVTGVLRKEWGYRGMVIAPVAAKPEDAVHPFRYGNASLSGCLEAGCDLIPPGAVQDAEKALTEGTDRKDLETGAGRVLEALMRLQEPPADSAAEEPEAGAGSGE